MRLPSLHQILTEAMRTFRRFPFVLCAAGLGTVAALILVDYEGPAGPTVFFRLLLASGLGISLLTGLTLLAEKRGWSPPLSYTVQAVGCLLLALYSLTVPLDLTNAPAIHIIRFLMLGVALHLFVAVAPFIARGETNGFWHYNKALFLRILTAALFAGVLYAGLSIALAALDNLFGMDVPGKRYFELWVLLAGVFTTWFFLAGIPPNLGALEATADYPKGLKIFAQYVLFPIVIVYLVILYAYMAKILVEWNWPKGWVSGLILGFSTVGTLSLILLHPLRERLENRWIQISSRWFVLAMLPLVVMLLLAVWRRVSEYGVTEGRYVVIAIGLWLGAMVAYFILSKGKSIKVIPATLCLLAALAASGPWGIFTVSEQSQVGRLESILTTNGILTEGKIRKAERPVPPGDSREVSSILSYLHDIHGLEGIEPWFAESLRQDSAGTGPIFKAPAIVAGMMGVEFITLWQSGDDDQIAFNADRRSILSVGGYEHLMRSLFIDAERKERRNPEAPLAYRMNGGMDTLTVIAQEGGSGADSLPVALRPLIDALIERYGNTTVGQIPLETMSVQGEGTGMRVKVYFYQIRLERKEGMITPASYDVDILCATASSGGSRSEEGPNGR